jgi:hypothetical protein
MARNKAKDKKKLGVHPFLFKKERRKSYKNLKIKLSIIIRNTSMLKLGRQVGLRNS